MEFVSFEIAKKLKEKRFREKCFAHYFQEELSQNICQFRGVAMDYSLMSYNSLSEAKILYPNYKKMIDAPTISQVLKWLREEKNIHFEIVACAYGYNVIISKTPPLGTDLYLSHAEYDGPNAGGAWDDYESVVLYGIEYTLDNLL